MKHLLAILLVTTNAFADDAPAPAPRAIVVHVPPTTVAVGQPIEIEAMIDAPFAETLTVRWRQLGAPAWQDATFERSSAGGWFASLPAAVAPGIQYYVRGRDSAGNEIDHFASEAAPHVVTVDPSLQDRLEQLDRKRLLDRRNEVAFEVVGHNFGNRYGLGDRFLRAELTYRYRVLRTLYEIGFGFGSVNGNTPIMSEPGGFDARRGRRYGFGEVRLRAHPSVYVDGRLDLGVSHDGFDQGVRGGITFGKPWRSCLQLGAEYLGDMGGSGWVRLQWDTAPPLLMGASVVRTDLPAAVIHAAGLYIAYDVSLRVMDRLTVKAQLSYGSRDGKANPGGGLGTAIDF